MLLAYCGRPKNCEKSDVFNCRLQQLMLVTSETLNAGQKPVQNLLSYLLSDLYITKFSM
jgi:hypothetical protein